MPKTTTALATLIACCAACGGRPPTGTPEDGGGGAFVTAEHRNFPPIVAGKGGPLRNPRLVLVIPANEDMGAKLRSFADTLAKKDNPWWTSFATEYGLGTLDVVKLSGPNFDIEAPSRVKIEAYLSMVLEATDPRIEPDDGSFFLVVLPKTSEFLVDEFQPNTLCMYSRGAFHQPYGTMSDVMGALMHCPPQRGQTAIENLTLQASQVLANAVSNPDGEGWALTVPMSVSPTMMTAWVQVNGNGVAEIADLCSVDTRFVDGENTYGRIYSAKAALLGNDPCVPALATPYYNADTELDWYGGEPGTTVSIPVRGWSTAAVMDWPIRVLQGKTESEDFTQPPRVVSTSTVTIAGITYQTINNERSATVHVPLPMNAKPGWWGTVILRSFQLDEGGIPPVGEDYAHRFIVGVHIPK